VVTYSVAGNATSASVGARLETAYIDLLDVLPGHCAVAVIVAGPTPATCAREPGRQGLASESTRLSRCGDVSGDPIAI
jgi:hypothetical protein